MREPPLCFFSVDAHALNFKKLIQPPLIDWTGGGFVNLGGAVNWASNLTCGRADNPPARCGSSTRTMRDCAEDNHRMLVLAGRLADHSVGYEEPQYGRWRLRQLDMKAPPHCAIRVT
jgi:hypothetical protein